MKPFLLFVIASFSFSVTAQNEDYTGTYLFSRESENGDALKYELQLNADQTFTFHNFRNIICSICKEENSYGKGTWKVENKIIYFATHLNDLDETHTLDFTGTTARIVKKSPRDVSDKVVPTALQFYKSTIFWIANLKLLLKE